MYLCDMVGAFMHFILIIDKEVWAVRVPSS